MQIRASERLHDQIIEEIKKLEHKDIRSFAVSDGMSMTCRCTKVKEKQKDCKAPGNQESIRKWLGHHQGISLNWPDWGEAISKEESEWSLETEGSGSAWNHCVGYGGKHFRELGWRKPP